jgi:hypothetical protein
MAVKIQVQVFYIATMYSVAVGYLPTYCNCNTTQCHNTDLDLNDSTVPEGLQLMATKPP